MSSFQAIVLAAGEGKRMKSSLPKVLHRIAGRPLVYYPVKAALDAGARSVVVVASPKNQVDVASELAATFGEAVQVVPQTEPRGTGDAARAGLPAVVSERTLILCGDTPLLEASTLCSLLRALDETPEARLSLLSCVLHDPHGYGRVLRSEAGAVRSIREQRDLASHELGVSEVNAGVYAAHTESLRATLAELKPTNAQGEYYLTDVVEILARSSPVQAVVSVAESLLGVNDRVQLEEAEELMQRRIRVRHAQAGVTIRGAACIDDTVRIEPDVCIESGVQLRGETTIGARTHVDVGCVVTDSMIGPNVLLKPYCVITASSVGDSAQLGPFAHLRPESTIEEQARIGNFVETKRTRVRRGAKANHLSYLGDGDIGEEANIGAGTILCNYDGFQKHQTIIGSRAFVGSDCQVVAPVTIGERAYIATGTTVTMDVPADALAVGRVRQQNKEGYALRLRERKAEAKKQSQKR
jgi:bifunctional UDP-N-acetylglucosamine pyrophosphorylase/glucosamine-1-phosphate N-acetyltransferase